MEPTAASVTGTTLHALLRDPTSPEAWEAFVKRYAPKIFRWCLADGAQAADAEDVTQEVLLKLARQISCFLYDPAKGSFRAWLKTLTCRTWLDVQKRRGLVAAAEDRQDPRPSLDDVLEEEFMLEVYEEAKRRVQARVSATTWRAFELLVTEGWTGARVAAELHLSVGAAHRAKWTVKEKLEEEVRLLEGPGPDSQEGRP
jgi:RNA polymerase sigma-70 factor (ECF subfamily)